MTEPEKKWEIPGLVMIDRDGGGLAKINIQTQWSTALIYFHGAHVTGFRKNGEPPLLFLSQESQFVAGKPIRGGVPICFPWFGPRPDEVGHGYARIKVWELIETKEVAEGGVQLRFQLAAAVSQPPWQNLRAEFVVTISGELAMEMVVTNLSADQDADFENCLHTYFAVGDIHQISITGLASAPYLDVLENRALKTESAEAIHITRQTDRTYPDTVDPVEIHDPVWRRKIRINKSGSASTVVWNPWTTQRLPDLGAEEYQRMVCVESGNVGPNKIKLPPGHTSRLKVVLSSQMT